MRRDRGAAALLLVTLLGLMLVVTSCALLVVRIVAVRAQVSSAADLAALAAATEGGCPAAARTAAANAATLLTCLPEGADVHVTAGRQVPLWPGRAVWVTVAARAGPS